jgi:hypothetical protein
MSKTEMVGSQKITTHYDEEEKEQEGLKHHSERRALNRKIRNESGHAPVNPEKDVHDIPRETKSQNVKVNGKRVKDDEDEDPPVTAADRRMFAEEAKKKKKEPLANQIGSRIPAALGGMGGAPSWLNRGTGMPAAMRMGSSMPPGLRMRSGSPPPWLFGASPVNPKKTAKKKPAALQNNGLPPWFRY